MQQYSGAVSFAPQRPVVSRDMETERRMRWSRNRQAHDLRTSKNDGIVWKTGACGGSHKQ